MLGGRPKGVNVEQHDVIFAVGDSIKDVTEVAKKHWKILVHIDSYVAIEEVDGYKVKITQDKNLQPEEMKLFFVNLGGYKPNDLEEYHKKLVLPARSEDEAKALARKDSFFAEGIKKGNAVTHIDDKFGVIGFDVDDVLIVNEQIDPKYKIILTADSTAKFSNNKIVPGYRPLPR